MDSLSSPAIAVPVSYLITLLIAAGARFVVSKEAPTIQGVIGTLILSGAVVISIYPWLEEKEYSHGTLNLIVALLAFGAKDILETLIKLASQIRKDPLVLLRDWLNKVHPGEDR